MILPYLKLPGIVEMDETYIGRRRFAFKNPFPRIRWIFGMHCRLTWISIMYFIKDKVHTTIAPIIKRHSESGCTMFSDMHMLYVNIPSGTSKIT